MAATIKIEVATGATPTYTSIDSADSASVTFGRDDLAVSTAPVPIPTSTGTKFSYLKYVCLDVTTAGSTTISNRTIALGAAAPTGIGVYTLTGGQGTYTQNNGTQGTAAGNYPADTSSALAAPTGYTALSTSAYTYDASSVSSGTTGPNGKYAQTIVGVDNTFTGGGGSIQVGGANGLVLTYNEQ